MFIQTESTPNQSVLRCDASCAAILKGTDCDMLRRGDASPLATFIRFSFGPLAPESFESDVEILKRALG